MLQNCGTGLSGTGGQLYQMRFCWGWQLRWILKRLEKLVKWERMSFKSAKPRSLMVKKGTVNHRFRFSNEGGQISTVSEKLVNCLVKLFNRSLKDSSSVQSTCQKLDSWLRVVDKPGLPGKFKAWIYHYSILLTIMWLLLVYEGQHLPKEMSGVAPKPQ